MYMHLYNLLPETYAVFMNIDKIFRLKLFLKKSTPQPVLLNDRDIFQVHSIELSHSSSQECEQSDLCSMIQKGRRSSSLEEPITPIVRKRKRRIIDSFCSDSSLGESVLFVLFDFNIVLHLLSL